MKLKGRRVVVIGGTSGMGLGAVRAAAEAGAEVIAAGRRPTAERESHPSQVQHAVVDITDPESIKALFDHAGEIDHLFVTATPSGGTGAFLEQDLATAQRFMYGKFFGSWAAAHHAAPNIRDGGSITFLSGGMAVRPRPGATLVTATFAAVEALSRALAVELGPLRVNTIRPGLIDSPMWDFLDQDARRRFMQHARETLPVRRVGAIEDIGHAAVFLMTNPYVTGTVIAVNGGETLVTLDG